MKKELKDKWILFVVVRSLRLLNIYIRSNRKYKWLTVEHNWFGEVYQHKFMWGFKGKLLRYYREWLPF